MLHELRQIYARRPVSLSGLDLINAILSEVPGRLAIDQATYDRFKSDLLSDAAMTDAFAAARTTLSRLTPQKTDRWAKPFPKFIEEHGPATLDVFYTLIRALQPDHIVETGVHTGQTTSMILAALKHNGRGHLTSIDLPSSGGMENIKIADDETGILIPRPYRDQWTLIRDNTLYALGTVMRDTKPSIFFHDSDHSYGHMAFEYGLAAAHLRGGGIVISDDTTLNSAFSDMAAGLGVKHFRHAKNLNFSVCAL